MTDEVMPNVIIPMHYRDENRGGHRLETVKDFANHFESEEMIHYYDSDTIEIVTGMEPQVAVLKYNGVHEHPPRRIEEKKTKRPGGRFTFDFVSRHKRK